VIGAVRATPQGEPHTPDPRIPTAAGVWQAETNTAKEIPLRADSHIWSIILAGGHGERTKDFVWFTLGHDKPKQYCTFLGRHSLVQHTIDRATSW
jgi:hypothetical protein